MGTQTRFLIVVAIAIGVSTAAPAALAAKGGGHRISSNGGTITLVLLNSTDGLPHYGQSVTFDVATTATDKPWVELDCSQSGTLVYQDWRGFFDGSLTGQDFILGTSKAWQSGDADCVAWLERYTKRGFSKLASTSFHVYP
jgi:hypothetical protein